MSISASSHSTEGVWSEFLARVSTLVTTQTLETWFKPMRLLSIGEKVCVECPSKFFMDWVEEHHRDKICYAFRDILGTELDIVFSNTSDGSEDFVPRRIESLRPPVPKKKLSKASEKLNPQYVFDEFVAGGNSRMTYAACLAVAEKPALVYNPLFIYGGVGLGKTHLMQAIGHHLLESRPRGFKIHYSSAETFMNELIMSIREGKSHEFREKYRTVDTLLIDDIQFLAGKESTQEEFFHTFNTLYGSSKQIVVTSDRPPKEIPTLEERLVSRFEWGLISDIQAPDYETRLAILRKKVEHILRVELLASLGKFLRASPH